MENEQLNFLFDNSVVITQAEKDDPELVDLAGYQVTKSELFAHTREPAITIWQTRIRFNMACLRKFPGIRYIQLLIHPEQKRLIIRPCEPDAPDSLRWATGGGEKELKNRDLLCRIFAGKIYDLMNWDGKYRYRILGKPVACEGEVLFLFQLTDFELFVSGKGRHSYLPADWRDYFGTPVEAHKNAYKINLADGYLTTECISSQNQRNSGS